MGLSKVPLTQGEFALIDEADLPIIEGYTWCVGITRSHKTARTNITVNGKSKALLMHRLILGLNNPSICVDHIDGNPLNNCRNNLRVCSQAENVRNKKKRPERTQFKGVTRYFRPVPHPFYARISVNRKTICIGSYETPEEAARAYDEAARKHHGIFAALNFPRTGEVSCQTQQ